MMSSVTVKKVPSSELTCILDFTRSAGKMTDQSAKPPTAPAAIVGSGPVSRQSNLTI